MTDIADGPVLSRRRLSVALRRSRDEAGMTQEQVAAAMDWSLSKLIRIEGGQVGISTSDLRVLLQLYAIVDTDRTEQLIRWARASRVRPWWAPYRESLPSPMFERFLGLEAAASVIDMFNPSIIPGLLQTRGYITAVLNGFPKTVLPADAVDVRIEIRLQRQEHVLKHSPGLTIVIDENALRRGVGNASVMREQLIHLLEMGTQPNITLLVLPFSAGPYVASGSFSILSFEEAEDRDAVHAEMLDAETLLDADHEVAMYRRLFAWLRDRSLDRTRSSELIREVADEFS
jgi:transcriptional regulator with XRE-family HTH domain